MAAMSSADRTARRTTSLADSVRSPATTRPTCSSTTRRRTRTPTGRSCGCSSTRSAARGSRTSRSSWARTATARPEPSRRRSAAPTSRRTCCVAPGSTSSPMPRRINPDIEVEALRWGEPSWTGNDWTKRYQWYKETIDAAYDTFGVEFDWISPAQNEVRHADYQVSELNWTIQFAKWLARDAAAPDARYDYSQIKIVALDSYRDGNNVAGRILANPEALANVDALGFHYDIEGGPNVTRLNKEYGLPILYSEGVAPMIDPQYRLAADPARGGVGGTASAADIADRFINAYRWSGAGSNPAHMTTFLFQPAVSAMYEGTQYSPKHLIRASDPWSGYWEGDVGVVTVRHFHQFIDHGWEYIEGATGGDGTKGDGGTNVDTSTRTVLTARTPAGAGGSPEWTQVHANNTRTDRYFEVKVADLGERGRPLYAWQTRGPDAGESYDANYFQNIGYYAPVRSEVIDGVEHDVYRVRVPAYSIVTLSTLRAWRPRHHGGVPAGRLRTAGAGRDPRVALPGRLRVRRLPDHRGRRPRDDLPRAPRRHPAIHGRPGRRVRGGRDRRPSSSPRVAAAEPRRQPGLRVERVGRRPAERAVDGRTVDRARRPSVGRLHRDRRLPARPRRPGYDAGELRRPGGPAGLRPRRRPGHLRRPRPRGRPMGVAQARHRRRIGHRGRVRRRSVAYVVRRRLARTSSRRRSMAPGSPRTSTRRSTRCWPAGWPW